MKKMLLVGISTITLLPIALLVDWAYYRDRKYFISPICYIGETPIRNDTYGDGHFGTKRKGGREHKGLDIYAPLHTEVVAAKGGRAETGYVKDGLGKYVKINHAEDYVTIYGHLSEIAIKNNKRARQGELIGYIGKTGNARYKNIKPHLHFETRKNGECLDPLLFLNLFCNNF